MYSLQLDDTEEVLKVLFVNILALCLSMSVVYLGVTNSQMDTNQTSVGQNLGTCLP